MKKIWGCSRSEKNHWQKQFLILGINSIKIDQILQSLSCLLNLFINK